jgi:hypothetical protein
MSLNQIYTLQINISRSDDLQAIFATNFLTQATYYDIKAQKWIRYIRRYSPD